MLQMCCPFFVSLILQILGFETCKKKNSETWSLREVIVFDNLLS